MVAARVFDISVRFASRSVFLSAVHGIVEIRELRAGRLGPLLHRYPLTASEEVQLFVYGGQARKVLRLDSGVGVDLGQAMTLASGMRDGREVARLVDRPVTLHEAEYRDFYFADDAPLLHAYEDGAQESVNAPTVRFHPAFPGPLPSTPSTSSEDTTLLDVPLQQLIG